MARGSRSISGPCSPPSTGGMAIQDWDSASAPDGKSSVLTELEARNLWRRDRHDAVMSWIGLAVRILGGAALVLFLVFALVCFAAWASHILMYKVWLSAEQLTAAKTVCVSALTMLLAPLVAPALFGKKDA